MNWRVTHKGWLLLCPVWLVIDGEEATPIPRGVPFCWLDFMIEIQQCINDGLTIFDPSVAGFLFHGITEVDNFNLMV